jgi:outer membrane protein assembly factor BamE (lipoprotein component of BamABCDE complex)
VECPIAKKMKLYVLKGMNQSEVLKILGEPFKKGIDSDNRWYYGDSSIVFDDPRGIAEKLKEVEKSLAKNNELFSKFREKYGTNPPQNEKAEQLGESFLESSRKALQEIYKVKTVHINDSCL